MNVTAIVVDDQEQQITHVGGVLRYHGIPTLNDGHAWVCKQSGIAGYQDGLSGLAAIRALKPTIAILDIILPHMGGVDVMRAILAEKLPVIPIMATGTSQMRRQAMQDGARHVLVKPYDHITLGNDLERILKAEGLL